MKTNTKNRKGFSLPEVMVSIALLAGVVISSTNLLVSSTRSNNSNAERITAFYLAQEGVELVRNIRDSNWLHGLSWQGDSAQGTAFTDAKIEPGTYTVANKLGTGQQFSLSSLKCLKDSNSNDPFSSCKKEFNDPTSLKNISPWTFKSTECEILDNRLNQQKCSEAKLYKHQNQTLGNYYNHQKQSNTSESKDSGFYRWIEISSLNDEEGKAHIKSIVAWQDSTGLKKVEIETDLTNWKQGPL